MLLKYHCNRYFLGKKKNWRASESARGGINKFCPVKQNKVKKPTSPHSSTEKKREDREGGRHRRGREEEGEGEEGHRD